MIIKQCNAFSQKLVVTQITILLNTSIVLNVPTESKNVNTKLAYATVDSEVKNKTSVVPDISSVKYHHRQTTQFNIRCV